MNNEVTRTEQRVLFAFLTDTDSSCKVCCRNSGGQCTPYKFDNGDYLYLRKGKPCTVGFCDGHVSALISLFLILFVICFSSVSLACWY